MAVIKHSDDLDTHLIRSGVVQVIGEELSGDHYTSLEIIPSVDHEKIIQYCRVMLSEVG